MRPSLPRPARTLGHGLGVIGRRLVDANPVPRRWTHVTKVDPEEAKKLPLLYPRWLAHTSAVSVGGSSDVTAANTERTFEWLAPLETPAFHEPSGPEHITERTRAAADFLAIPEVLNGDVDALVGELGTGVERLLEELAPTLVAEQWPWLPERYRETVADLATSWLLEAAVFEAYIVQNPDSAAARESGVDAADRLDPETARHRALAADRHLGSELVYLEYSGTFGGDEAVEILAEIDGALRNARLWYGGGLDDAEKVAAVRDAGADTVVVGDVFHDIASEEAALLADAEAEFDGDADPDAIADWVADRVDGDSAATRYLATAGVDDPLQRARRYERHTVAAWLDLLEATDGGSSPDAVGEGSGQALARRLRPAMPGDRSGLADRVARAALAARDGEDDDAAVHLSPAAAEH